MLKEDSKLIEEMCKTGTAYLYLSERDGQHYVTNWRGTLEAKVNVKVSRHNFGGVRRDFWFALCGRVWHGYQIGYWNQVAYCRKTKRLAEWYHRPFTAV